MTTEEKFKSDKEYRLYRLRHFAKKYKWKLENDSGVQLKFTNADGTILKIDYHATLIETSLSHPSHGYTTLLRKGIFTGDEVENIFRNPRQHMNKKISSEYVK